MSGLDREEDVIRIIGEAGESAAELANRIKTGQWAYCPEEDCIVARTAESAFVRFANEAKLQEYLAGKVDKVEGKGLSTNDYTTVEKIKLAGIQAGAQVNTVTSVASKTGAVTLVKADVGLGNVDNTSDANKPVSTAQATAISSASVADRNRMNHTGVQSASTIIDLNIVGDARWVRKSGDTMSGHLEHPDGVFENHSATVGQMDEAISNANTANRRRSNHTGTQPASTISDLQEAITNNTSVVANTAKVTNQTHTGDVTGSTVLTIADNAVSESKIANRAVSDIKLAEMPANTIKGRIHLAGTPGDLTPELVRTMLNVEDGAQANTVTSVAGKTGAVTLVKNDVGLGNVDNTSDANKPVSTAQANAIANASAEDRKRSNHTGTQAISTVDGLQGVLDGKAPLSHVDDEAEHVKIILSSSFNEWWDNNSFPMRTGRLIISNGTQDGRLPVGWGILQYFGGSSIRGFAIVTTNSSINTRWIAHWNNSTQEWSPWQVIANGIVESSATLSGVLSVGDTIEQGLRKAQTQINDRVTQAQGDARWVRKSGDTISGGGAGAISDFILTNTIAGIRSHFRDSVATFTHNDSVRITEQRVMTNNTVFFDTFIRDGVVVASIRQDGQFTIPNATADTHAVNRRSVKNADIGALTTASGAIQSSDSINTAVSKVSNNTGLTRGTESGKTGYWLSGDNRANKGDIGTEAVDLSFSKTGSPTGSTGNYSHAEGDGTTASGTGSHAEGGFTTASEDYSHAEGRSSIASGWASHAEGTGTVAGGQQSHAEGISNEILTTAPHGAHAEGQYCNPVGQNKQSVIGIGFNSSNRKDGRIMWTDGTMTLPECNNQRITSRGAKSVVTKEYVDTNGTTANRPTDSDRTVGKFYYDTTIGKPIWWNGSVWKDANGTTV